MICEVKLALIIDEMRHLCELAMIDLVLGLFNDASIATVVILEYLYLYAEFRGAVLKKMMATIGKCVNE